MAELTRREAIGMVGAAAVGAAMSRPIPVQAAGGGLRQSVCRWCFNDIPLRDFFDQVRETGLTAATQQFHRRLRARPEHPRSPRPVVFNTWEATYFDHDLDRLLTLAERAARINGLAGRHQNQGLRAFYFALAALAWFVHPVAFIIATMWVVAVLHRRDFRSRSQRIVRGDS